MEAICDGSGGRNQKMGNHFLAVAAFAFMSFRLSSEVGGVKHSTFSNLISTMPLYEVGI